MPNLKSLASLVLTTFLGAFVGYLMPYLGTGVPPESQLKSIAIGAALAGVSALVHLYQPVPASGSVSGGGAVPGSRGFAGFRTMIVTAAIGIFVAACSLIHAIAPAAQTLEECIEGFVTSDAGAALTFVDFVLQGAAKCDTDVEAFVEAIIDSKDATIAQYAPEARAAKADPAKMGALKAKVAERRALLGLDAGK